MRMAHQIMYPQLAMFRIHLMLSIDSSFKQRDLTAGCLLWKRWVLNLRCLVTEDKTYSLHNDNSEFSDSLLETRKVPNCRNWWFLKQ